MGQTLLEAVFAAEDIALAAALEVPASELIGHDAGERFGRATGVVVSTDVPAAVAAADVLTEAARTVPIVFASNMSVGVTVLSKLVEIAAQRLGEGYDIEILEMHHRH